MGDLIKDLEPVTYNSTGTGSWSSLTKNSRSRHPIRLSMSVDSIIPYCDSPAGSQELLHQGNLTDEGSLNNILDAYGDKTSTTGSWSALLDPQLYLQPHEPHQVGQQQHHVTRTPIPSPITRNTLPSTTSTLLFQVQSTLREYYRKLLDSKLNSSPPYYKRAVGAPSSLSAVEPSIQPVTVTATSVPSTPSSTLPHPPPQQPTTYWLEGLPGSGKSTHCLSLLSNWMQDNVPEFSLLLYVPLHEIQSIQSFIKSIMRTSNKWGSIWNLLNNPATAASLCVILDDVDHDLEPNLLDQVQDVLNGKLFQGASLVCTTSSSKILSNLQPAAVRYKCCGLNWLQINGIVQRYFISNGSGRVAEFNFMEYLNSCLVLHDLVSCPSTLVLLLLAHDGGGQSLELSQRVQPHKIYSRIVQTLANQQSSDHRKKSPAKLQKLSEDIGRMLLHSPNSAYHTEGEVSSAGAQDAVKYGVLVKSSPVHYRLLHWRLRDYFIGLYLASLSQSNFRREFDRIQTTASENTCLQLLVEILSNQRAAGLGPGLDLLFKNINLLDIQLQTLLELIPHSCNTAEYCSELCYLLQKHNIHHVITSDSSWAPILSQHPCPLDSIEVVFKPGQDTSQLFEALTLNTSIQSVKLCAVPGQEWSNYEINAIARQLLKLTTEKPGLGSLSLHFTLLTEREHFVYQPLVDILVFSLENRVPAGIRSLSVEMDLNRKQLWELATAVENSNLKILNLPNLCVVDGECMRAVARMLNGVEELSLHGCWRPTPTQARHFNQSQSLQRSWQSSSHSLQRSSQPSPANSMSAGYPSPKLASASSIFRPLFNPSPLALTKLNLSKSTLTMEDLHTISSYLQSTSTISELHFEGMRLVDVMNILLSLDTNQTLRNLHLSSNHVLIGDDSLSMVASVLLKNRGLRNLAVGGWVFNIEKESTLGRIVQLLAGWQLESLDVAGCTFNVKCQVPNAAVGQQASSGSGTLKKGLKLFSSTLQLNSNNSSTVSTMVLPNLVNAKFSGLVINMQRQPAAHPPSENLIQIVNSLSCKPHLRHLDLSLPKTDPSTSAAAINASSSAQMDAKSYLKLLKSICNGCSRLESLHLQNYKLRILDKELSQVRHYLTGLHRLRSINLDGTECSAGAGDKSSGGGRRDKSQPRVDHALLLPIIASLKSSAVISWSDFKPMDSLCKCLTEFNPAGGAAAVGEESLQIELKGATLVELKAAVKSHCGGVAVEYAGDGGAAACGVLVVKRLHGGGSGVVMRGIRKLF